MALTVPRLVLWILITLTFIECKKSRDDPAYAQEFKQVRDEGTLVATVCQQHQHSAHGIEMSCAYVRSTVEALKSLGFAKVRVFDCFELHHKQHHNPHHKAASSLTVARNGTSLHCPGILYESIMHNTKDLRDIEESAVFVLLGDTMVPSVVGEPTKLHGGSTQQHHTTRVYLHVGSTHHMHVLASKKDHVLPPREARVAARNMGLYDHIVFFDETDRRAYADLMYPLFSSDISHSGHPTLVGLPPRLLLLSSNHTRVLQQPLEIQQRLEQLIIDSVIGGPFLAFVRRNLNFLRSTVVLDRPRRIESLFSERQTGVFGTGPAPASNHAVEEFVALIIEPRVEASFEFCVRNVLYHLGEAWVLQVHHSKSNEKFVKHVLHDVSADRVEFVLLPEPFLDSGHYNQYVKSAAFWSALHSKGIKHTLIFQSDSFMLETNSTHKISEYLKYSFIGAPWHQTPGTESAEWLRSMQKKKLLLNGVGNGGFSLRNVSSMLLVASNHRSKNPNVNEDVFFLQYLPQYEHLGVKIPSRQEAYRFAREVPCPDLDSSDPPLAVHSAWAYVSKSQAQDYFSRSIVVY